MRTRTKRLLYLGHNGCGDRPSQEGLEVEADEPLVRLDVLRPALDAAVALGEVRDKELLDEALGVLVHEPWERELPRQDQLVDLLRLPRSAFNNTRPSAKKKVGWGARQKKPKLTPGLQLVVSCFRLYRFLWITTRGRQRALAQYLLNLHRGIRRGEAYNDTSGLAVEPTQATRY